MCGRFTLTDPQKIMRNLLTDLDLVGGHIPELPPRYNIAPTQTVPVVARKGDERPTLAMMRWAFVPSWATPENAKKVLINARSESVHRLPTFRDSFKSRRCLVPADGYFEWKAINGKKQPYYFTREGHQPFAFGGIWDSWCDESGKELESFAILTREADEEHTEIHHRMPVIIPSTDYEDWLRPDVPGREILSRATDPAASVRLAKETVSLRVNSARHDDPGCVEPDVSQGTLF